MLIAFNISKYLNFHFYSTFSCHRIIKARTICAQTTEKYLILLQMFKDNKIFSRCLAANENMESFQWAGLSKQIYVVFPLASVCLCVCVSVCLSVTKSCPLYNLITVTDISTKLHTFVKHIETTCHAQEP